jgi:hypothetical protein
MLIVLYLWSQLETSQAAPPPIPESPTAPVSIEGMTVTALSIQSQTPTYTSLPPIGIIEAQHFTETALAIETLMPMPTLTSTGMLIPTADARPDLVGFATTSMEGYELGQCVTEYRTVFTTLCIGNHGKSTAGPFTVRTELGYPDSWAIEGLSPREERCIKGQGAGIWGIAVIDPNNEVEESVETNNQITITTATPPPLCTPSS